MNGQSLVPIPLLEMRRQGYFQAGSWRFWHHAKSQFLSLNVPPLVNSPRPFEQGKFMCLVAKVKEHIYLAGIGTMCHKVLSPQRYRDTLKPVTCGECCEGQGESKYKHR